VTISGKPESIDALRKKIKSQDPILEKEFIWFQGGAAYGLVDDPTDIPDDGDLSLTFTSKWRPPAEDLETLAQTYPDLNIHVQYEEPACAVYGTLSLSGGVLTEDRDMDTEDYLDEFDEGYNGVIASIEEPEYGEFLQNLSRIDELEDDSETCSWPGLVEKHYLKRLKDEDLPLLVSHEWISDRNKTEYERRLKREVIGELITNVITKQNDLLNLSNQLTEVVKKCLTPEQSKS
jgi:hypothetical protein